MKQEEALALLGKAQAVIPGHFVGTNRNHLSHYVAKDKATRLTSIVSQLCEGIANRFKGTDIDAVVAPAVGAIALSQWTARYLTLNQSAALPEVLALYSEHLDTEVCEVREGDGVSMIHNAKSVPLETKPGSKLIVRSPSFTLKRGFNSDVKGKRVLVVEDVLTTGGSAKRTVEAVEEAGGIVIALAVLANGGKVTAETCGVSWLEALVNIEREVYTAETCAAQGLCAKGVPINTDFGHGKDFLARQASN